MDNTSYILVGVAIVLIIIFVILIVVFFTQERRKVIGEFCTSDKQCAFGTHCGGNGVCAAGYNGLPSGSTCNISDQCQIGLTCQNGICSSNVNPVTSAARGTSLSGSSVTRTTVNTANGTTVNRTTVNANGSTSSNNTTNSGFNLLNIFNRSNKPNSTNTVNSTCNQTNSNLQNSNLTNSANSTCNQTNSNLQNSQNSNLQNSNSVNSTCNRPTSTPNNTTTNNVYEGETCNQPQPQSQPQSQNSNSNNDIYIPEQQSFTRRFITANMGGTTYYLTVPSNGNPSSWTTNPNTAFTFFGDRGILYAHEGSRDFPVDVTRSGYLVRGRNSAIFMFDNGNLVYTRDNLDRNLQINEINGSNPAYFQTSTSNFSGGMEVKITIL